MIGCCEYVDALIAAEKDVDMRRSVEIGCIMNAMGPEPGRRLREISACMLAAVFLSGCMSDGEPSPDAGKAPASASSRSSETATAGGVTQPVPLHKGGKPPRACAHTDGATPPVCVHALFHRYPNFAPNSMCNLVANTARRLRDYGFEVSVREVSGSQPSNIVTNWWSRGTRGNVRLIVGGDNPSCAT